MTRKITIKRAIDDGHSHTFDINPVHHAYMITCHYCDLALGPYRSLIEAERTVKDTLGTITHLREVCARRGNRPD